MIGGKDWDEHNKFLAQLLQRLEDHNLTLRRESANSEKRPLTSRDTCLHKKALNQAQRRFKLSKTVPHQHPMRNSSLSSTW